MKKASDEFMYIRDNIKDIGHMIKLGNTVEASFMLGCLHSICHENAIQFNSSGAGWVYEPNDSEQTV